MKRLFILAMIAGGSLIATTGHAQVIVHGRIGFGLPMPVPVPAPRVYYSTPYYPQPIVTAPAYGYGRIYPYYDHRRFYRDYDFRYYRHPVFHGRRHW
ncbi:MAG TPA: hypothetical protein VMH01_07125 [Puia sp.]|nr:hypothetical protein [Puia sp.]